MSTFQGQCGYCDPSGCWSSPVFPGQTEQFGASDQREFRATAVVYGHVVARKQRDEVVRFASATDYLRYKKGLLAAGSAAGYRPYRPPPSAAIASMIATGCPCNAVCPVSTAFENAPFGGPVDVGDAGFQAFIDGLYGTSTPIPAPPMGYPFDFFIAVVYPVYCNSTSETLILLDGGGNTIPPLQITNLGPNPAVGLGGVFIIYPSSDTVSRITLTAANSCGSSTGDVFLEFGPLLRSVTLRETGPKWWSRRTFKKN